MSILFLLSIVPYMIPTVVAAYRDHRNKTAILALNLLLGWTVIGWIVALIWACVGEGDVQRVEAMGDEFGRGGLRLQGRDPRLDGSALERSRRLSQRDGHSG